MVNLSFIWLTAAILAVGVFSQVTAAADFVGNCTLIFEVSNFYRIFLQTNTRKVWQAVDENGSELAGQIMLWDPIHNSWRIVASKSIVYTVQGSEDIDCPVDGSPVLTVDGEKIGRLSVAKGPVYTTCYPMSGKPGDGSLMRRVVDAESLEDCSGLVAKKYTRAAGASYKLLTGECNAVIRSNLFQSNATDYASCTFRCLNITGRGGAAPGAKYREEWMARTLSLQDCSYLVSKIFPSATGVSFHFGDCYAVFGMTRIAPYADWESCFILATEGPYPSIPLQPIQKPKNNLSTVLFIVGLVLIAVSVLLIIVTIIVLLVARHESKKREKEASKALEPNLALYEQPSALTRSGGRRLTLTGRETYRGNW